MTPFLVAYLANVTGHEPFSFVCVLYGVVRLIVGIASVSAR